MQHPCWGAELFLCNHKIHHEVKSILSRLKGSVSFCPWDDGMCAEWIYESACQEDVHHGWGVPMGCLWRRPCFLRYFKFFSLFPSAVKGSIPSTNQWKLHFSVWWMGWVWLFWRASLCSHIELDISVRNNNFQRKKNWWGSFGGGMWFSE